MENSSSTLSLQRSTYTDQFSRTCVLIVILSDCAGNRQKCDPKPIEERNVCLTGYKTEWNASPNLAQIKLWWHGVVKMGENEDEILKGNFQGKTGFGNPRKFASICDSARERQTNHDRNNKIRVGCKHMRELPDGIRQSLTEMIIG